MSAKVDRELAAALPSADPTLVSTQNIVTPIVDDGDERWGGHALPGDHPAWMKDTLSLSQRARALLTKLRPVAIRVVSYWDHTVRSIVCSGRRMSVDASGSYRVD